MMTTVENQLKRTREQGKWGVNFNTAELLWDLVFFNKDNVIYYITTFSTQLKNFEAEDNTTEERL